MAGFENQVKERAKDLKYFFKKGVKIVGDSCKKGWLKTKYSLTTEERAPLQLNPTGEERILLPLGTGCNQPTSDQECLNSQSIS
ncbi:hypothetical protein FH972_014603 [Carpinus fangiana]|uniref:Uncharacterized protein n=1 Tax=Carpinus fangiana TaxID=176857 RepID=A0A5N6RAH2_9ROSI|nr:hypothetical protein FH972_014603 [Carpinus fangiana]